MKKIKVKNTKAKSSGVSAGSPLRLDLGCGPRVYVDPNRPEDKFQGVDILDFGQEHRVDLGNCGERWPWDSSTVEEVYSSHFIEHLEPRQRVWFWNELHRVMKPGAKATIIAPYWSSMRAYGDPTHRWPPICEYTFFYLNRKWRLGDESQPANAPHVDVKFAGPDVHGLECDFDFTVGYLADQQVMGSKHPDQQSVMIRHWINAVNDVQVTLEKRVG
jgi:hypothetical protein